LVSLVHADGLRDQLAMPLVSDGAADTLARDHPDAARLPSINDH
jgi:hypothetical protein